MLLRRNSKLALRSRTLFALARTPRVPEGASVGSRLRPESWLQGQYRRLYTSRLFDGTSAELLDLSRQFTKRELEPLGP